MDIGVILSVLLSVCIWRVHRADSHGGVQHLGELNFVCKEGWEGHDGNCYYEVTVPMQRDVAAETCHRQGGHLLWLDNEMEYDYISNIATSHMFWVGLKYSRPADYSGVHNEAAWPNQQDHARTVDLRHISYWDINEPDQGDGSTEACAIGQKDKGLALKSCTLFRPFFCKYEACLQGYTPCATGGGCYSASDMCDGRYDCDDHSDERDCRTADHCTYYYKLTETAGSFDTKRIEDGARCSFILEAPIGKRVKLTVPRTTTTLEEDIAFLEIWTGSPDLNEATRMASLTGPTAEKSYISKNNFLTVLLMVGDVFTSRNGITLSWTTDIADISMNSTEVTVENTWKYIHPPFTRESTPLNLELTWKLEATQGEIIMYYMDSYDHSEDAVLVVLEGGMETSPMRTMDPADVKKQFFASAASSLLVYWNSGSGMSRFKLWFKTGCSIEINETVGTLQVPNFWEPGKRYPSDLTCTWTLTGGQTKQRGLNVNFDMVELGADPRTDTRLTQRSQDFITIWKSPNSTEVSETVTVSGKKHSPDGYMKIEFKSDLIINEGVGFTAKYSIDCPQLVNLVSGNTILNPAGTATSESTVTVTCELGYKFDAAEYHSMTSVDLVCKEGGTWTYENKTDIRIPNCKVVQCGVPDEIQNGYILSVEGTSYGMHATYKCNDGFTKNPNTTALCNQDGEWESLPGCTAATCVAADIQLEINGNYTVEAGNPINPASGVDVNTVVKFECDPGFELYGSLRSYCQHSGWSDPKPECRRIYCPFPSVEHMEPNSTSIVLRYGDNETLTCMSGYGINGDPGFTSRTVRCGNDRMLTPEFVCSDFNECDSSPCDTTSTRCENTEGSYRCNCRDGFQTMASNSHRCEDIRQCDIDNGGCDTVNGQCVEETGGLPGYRCVCNQGYVLFAETGPDHGYSVATSETGHRYGDQYYYNHTCIRVSCERPTNINHATLLSRETLFRYNDTVDLVCEDGYHITGEMQTATRQNRTCGADGMWNNADFSCSARTCSTENMNPSSFDHRPTVSFGEEVVLMCKYTETRNITRRAICMYKGGITVFGGDDITTCPQIDCGDPGDQLPSGGRLVGGPSSLHLSNPSYTFSCDSGYIKEGESELTQDDQIQCKENGRWSFGTLRCSGQKCSDPGTPAEAVQVVTNYEANQKLHFTCNRGGYEPVLSNYLPGQEYTCIYDSMTNTADWVPSLATLPVCTDKTAPVILNLPTATLYRDRMDVANFSAPVYTDNFGVKLTSATDNFISDDIVKEDKTIIYRAEDFDGNTATASVVIEVINRAIRPTLTCPVYFEIPVESEGQTTYDITQNVTSDGALEFSRQSVPVSVYEIGKHVRIDVTATNQHGTKAYCSFLVTYKANRCFTQTLYPDSNAVRNCGDQQDNTITCTSTCKTNYLYGDGSTQKNFTCSGTNNWNMNYPHVFCLPSESPAYQFQAYVIHQLQYLSRPCETQYRTAVTQYLNDFENQMTALTECNNINWDIISHTASTGRGSTEFSSNYTVKLVTTETVDQNRNNCLQAIKDNMEVFDFPSGNLFCSSSINNQRPGISTTSLMTTEGAFDCLTSSYLLIDSQNGKKCIPCGPGEVYDNGNCAPCAEGTYKGGVDGTCVQCDSGQTPNSEKTDCIITCPEGFRSLDGLMPCTPCATNSYWVDSQTCTACNPSTSTSGREGVTDSGGCHAKCPTGTYSQTGYQDMDCHACPRNFYQPSEGQTTCVACDDDEVTDDIGKTDISSCHQYDGTCDRAYCSDHGNCEFSYHRPVCICDEGYRGETCQESFHICDGEGSPCMNGGNCVPTPGGTYTNYTCECKVVKDNSLCYGIMYTDKEGGNENNPISQFAASLSECQTQCLNNDSCKSLSHYTADFGTSFCLLYDRVIAENDLLTRTGKTHYNKNCPPVFGGPNCENDLKDGCNETNQCSEESMCKNTAVVLNGYECLCPSVGGYQGTYCEQTARPCDNVTCENGGNCVDHGNVRAECDCPAGFTGQLCEINIDDCTMNPNACLFGTCNDLVNSYNCSCNGSFGGDRCQNSPNFCASNNCLGNVCYNSIDDQDGRCHCEGRYFNQSGAFACSETSAKPCDLVNCKNNGTCTNLPDYQSRCDCEAGYTGSLCQHSVDDCTVTSCDHGRCIDEHQDVRCECEVGYTGDRCDINIKYCDPNPCDHGTCQDLVNGFVCNCEDGYTGSECQTDINECLSQPCYNGGNCTDLINGFTCQCMDGWTIDSNCREWNTLCTPGYCNNNGECFDLTRDKMCRCVGGTQGDTCEGLQSVCDTMSNVDVCMNNGSCKKELGSAHCQCPLVLTMDRCFSIVYPGKEGGHAGQYGSETSAQNLEACKQRCLDTPECQSLSYFSNFKQCKIYSTKSPVSSLINVSDAVHIEKDCPTDYTGKACEQVKDWCSANNNPCLHNGRCVTRSDKGFQCMCDEGYSGTTCEIVANPCEPSPCPTGADCRHSVTQHYCQCPEGREIMGGQCRLGSYGTNLNLLVANAAEDHTHHMENRVRRASHGGGSYYEVPEDIPRLKTAFRMSGDTLSVQLRVRVHSYPMREPYNILRLVGSEQLYPLSDENPKLVLLITGSGVQLTYDSEMIELDFDPLVIGEWYHIGVSLDSAKKLWYTIKAVEVQDPAELTTGSVDFSNLNAQLVFGDTDMVVEFNRVTVWETSLNNSDFANALVNKDYVADNAVLTQGWYNIRLTKASKILTSNFSADGFNVNKTAPAINCDRTPYEKTTSDRIVRTSELQHLTAKIKAVSAVADASVMHSIPDALTWGYYPGIVKVEANRRHALCRFPVYIKYNDVCPAPVNDGDVSVTPCDSTDNDGVCNLNCQSGDAQLSAPRPRYKPCGALGVYDWKKSWKNLVLPTCAVAADQKYVVDVSMQYIFSINCDLIGDIENKIKKEIKAKFRELNTFWVHICEGTDNTDCTNLKFQKAECGTGNDAKRIHLEYSLVFDSDKLTALKVNAIPDGQLKLDDALKSIIVLEDKIELDRFASARPDFTTVIVTMRADCTTLGYNLIKGVCVPCGKGLVYNSSLGQCEKCPIGSYKGDNHMACQSCGEEKTTINEGATSESKCVAECNVGRFFNTSVGSCQNCTRHYYQDKVGQSFCHPCQYGYKTQGEGTDSADGCKKDCDPGYERNATGSCVLCSRGHWRDLTKDDCQPCEQNRTTLPGDIAVNRENCSMDDCAIGKYWNGSMCKPCEHGKYQDQKAMLQCKSCGGNKTTEVEGESSADQCIFYCAAGYEVYPQDAEACRPCQRGYYKDNVGDGKFLACKQCENDKTTDDIAANRSDLCEYALCNAGEYVMEQQTNTYVCEPCSMDKYQSKQHPYKGDVCEDCPPTGNGVDQGTRVGGANSSDLCKPICPGGHEYKEATDECAPCPVGKYKPDSDRFGTCASCDVGFTTDGVGKTSDSDCSIRDCDPGSYDNGARCVLCAYGFYQEERTQTSCIRCGTNLNTSTEGSTNRTDCQAFCGAGLYVSDPLSPNDCNRCPEGYYKPLPSYDPCMQCRDDFTSNVNRTACNILYCSPGKEHVQRTNPGIVIEECVECVARKYKNTSGNTACLDCPPGLTNNKPGKTTCDLLHCEPGKYEKDGKCELCDIRFYKEMAGNQECFVCPPGKTTPGRGTASPSGCSRVICGEGSYREGETTCVGCPLNQYQDQTGQTNCTVCPDSKITMTTNSTSVSDCVPECGMGEEYNANNKDCDKCQQRFYKDSVGNTESCTECPVDKTTAGTGSTSVADCTEDDCSAGSYVTTVGNNVVCEPCPKGEYQPGRSQTGCITCPANTNTDCTGCTDKKTTEYTGTTKESKCVVQCKPGYELLHPINTTSPCKACGLGLYGPAGSNKCFLCEEGKISSTIGQDKCSLPDPNPKPPPITVNLFFKFKYRAATDCSENSLNIIEANIQSTIQTGMSKRISRYRGLCGINSSVCSVLVIVRRSSCSVLSTGRRRKRAVSHNFDVEVTMQNVSSLVTDTDADTLSVLETDRVVARLFESNPEEFSPELGVIEYGEMTAPPTQTAVCEPGYEVSGETCSACQPGTKWSSGSETCVNCDVNEYQDMTRSTNCKMCPDLTYNDNEGATSMNDCKSFCVENPDYCNGHGNCSETGRKTASCSCATDYIGDRCDSLRFCRANPNYCNGHGTCLETTPTAGVCSCDTGYFGDQCQNPPYCSEHPNYCNNRGTCSEDNNNNPSCSCNPGFYGNKCESKETPDSDYNALIGGLVGGIGGLLVIILIVVAVVRCLTQRGKEDKRHRYLEQSYQAEEPEYFRNPVYDNRSNAGSLPAVFQALPAADYYPNPYEQYSYSSKRPKASRDQSVLRMNDRQGEDEYVWQA